MPELTHDEHASLAAALGNTFPVRWATWALSVQGDGARADDEGNVLLSCTLAWFSEDGLLLGATEDTRAFLHLADLGDAPIRAQAYLRALAASFPAIARLRGWQPGDPTGGYALADLLPSTPLLDDLSLQTFEQFEEALARPPWLDGAEGRAKRLTRKKA